MTLGPKNGPTLGSHVEKTDRERPTRVETLSGQLPWKEYLKIRYEICYLVATLMLLMSLLLQVNQKSDIDGNDDYEDDDDILTMFCLFVLLLYVPSQQLWSLRHGQFT